VNLIGSDLVTSSTFLYLVFAVVLGATCVRADLQTDYLIAEKVIAL
jgi:hypothetical protein